ncbi:methyltransferase family protein [Kordiimonas lacus]|uniref:Protein-S-isoprenylcysteine O-methyltransferase Ste14 n=1 Tax=Kordiimonas lacus TaxID=637679 RepID=A0A1G6YL45_9PROT|nr:isoprenylcysteine carboxylmethyltransferase family protein [Kordiimonas lacus]SDD91119.1 Protein-S-isoprenylcysteine O-methyltransferase Ste14 [Kordiimonas lacus]
MPEKKRPNVPRILPPHLFFLTATLMLGIGYWETGGFGVQYWPLGLTIFGIWMAAREKNRFVAAGTSFYPGEDAHKLITYGAYRFTRNPMYLGMVLGLIGLWPLTGGYWPVVPFVLFISIITIRFILPEERRLEELFGDEYRTYKSKVRRWL